MNSQNSNSLHHYMRPCLKSSRYAQFNPSYRHHFKDDQERKKHYKEDDTLPNQFLIHKNPKNVNVNKKYIIDSESNENKTPLKCLYNPNNIKTNRNFPKDSPKAKKTLIVKGCIKDHNDGIIQKLNEKNMKINGLNYKQIVIDEINSLKANLETNFNSTSTNNLFERSGSNNNNFKIKHALISSSSSQSHSNNSQNSQTEENKSNSFYLHNSTQNTINTSFLNTFDNIAKIKTKKKKELEVINHESRFFFGAKRKFDDLEVFDEKNSSDIYFLDNVFVRKQKFHSNSKHISEIRFNTGDKNKKMKFNLYKDNECGFSDPKWKDTLILIKRDDDVPSDNEIIKEAQSFCVKELKNAIKDIMIHGVNKVITNVKK